MRFGPRGWALGLDSRIWVKGRVGQMKEEKEKQKMETSSNPSGPLSKKEIVLTSLECL